MSLKQRYREENPGYGCNIVEEYEKILYEQKKHIDSLKEQKYLLKKKIDELESDRKYVLDIMYETQKNSDTIIKEAEQKAESIISDAKRRTYDLKNCEKTLIDMKSYISSMIDKIKEK